MERPCVFDPCYAPPAYACCTQTLSVKNAQGNLISTVDMPAGCCTGGCCATNFYAKVNPSPSPNPDPNPDADPDPNPNPNPNPTPSPKPLTPRMRAATSSTRCVRRYAGLSLAAAATCARPRMPTQASNPRLAGRVPGRSATHTREPCLGQLLQRGLRHRRLRPRWEVRQHLLLRLPGLELRCAAWALRERCCVCAASALRVRTHAHICI